MKVAIIGSRSITAIDLDALVPPEATEILSGGARGVDALARAWAEAHGLPCREFLPDYRLYGRGAPLKRNADIVREADLVIAIWDGASRGTAFTISECSRTGTPCRIAGTQKTADPRRSPPLGYEDPITPGS